jgi:hypothetical protein
MIDANDGRGPSADNLPHDVNAHNEEALAAPTPESGETHDGAVSGSARPLSATPVSSKKIEANRRNARQSTGPKTDAGKHASRLNALKHGLLAKEIVITRGDYKEDKREFAQLLQDLWEQLTPVGVAAELEVQQIALCYWRKKRAIRYEHGAIRQRTGDMRWRKQVSRAKQFEEALSSGSSLEHSSLGIEHLIDRLQKAKQEVLDGKVTDGALDWLEEHYPADLDFLDEMEPDDESADGHVVMPPEYSRALLDRIDAQLRRLSQLRAKVARIEELDLESRIRTAALPEPSVVEHLVRYEASNDRELDRAVTRLERMQERQRAAGGTHPTN